MRFFFSRIMSVAIFFSALSLKAMKEDDEWKNDSWHGRGRERVRRELIFPLDPTLGSPLEQKEPLKVSKTLTDLNSTESLGRMSCEIRTKSLRLPSLFEDTCVVIVMSQDSEGTQDVMMSYYYSSDTARINQLALLEKILSNLRTFRPRKISAKEQLVVILPEEEKFEKGTFVRSVVHYKLWLKKIVDFGFKEGQNAIILSYPTDPIRIDTDNGKDHPDVEVTLHGSKKGITWRTFIDGYNKHILTM